MGLEQSEQAGELEEMKLESGRQILWGLMDHCKASEESEKRGGRGSHQFCWEYLE